MTKWQPGDEVVIHCNQASYEDIEVHGLDPMAAPSQKIWGYETTWGSFAQFTKVQAQQLIPKPKNLTWEEAASYGLTYFTAYRMLIHQCELQAGDKVLIWGAAGGLGVFATQLCKITGAESVGVVSSAEKGELVEQLGATGWIDRNEFKGMMRKGDETPDEEKARFKESRRFSKASKEILGGPPDIVFEHVGQATFPTSVFTVKPFGKVVICGAHDGLQPRLRRALPVDAPEADHRLALRERLRGHKANELIEQGMIRPVLWQTMGFDAGRRGAPAHAARTSTSARSRSSSAPEETGEGKTAEGPGAIYAEVGDVREGDKRRHDPLARQPVPRATSSRTPGGPPPRPCSTTARRGGRSIRSKDDPLDFTQIAVFEIKQAVGPLLVLGGDLRGAGGGVGALPGADPAAVAARGGRRRGCALRLASVESALSAESP